MKFLCFAPSDKDGFKFSDLLSVLKMALVMTVRECKNKLGMFVFLCVGNGKSLLEHSSNQPTVSDFNLSSGGLKRISFAEVLYHSGRLDEEQREKQSDTVHFVSPA